MGHETDIRQSFFRTITKDKTANTIAIAAASLVPLMAMVGGGVDASRYYMAETRMQAACDAGALGARRAMSDDDFTTEHQTIGNNFFDQNFEDGMFGSEDLVRTYSAGNDGEVVGTASGKMPTTIMGAFGYTEFDLTVECEADINISNSDIMFVLDVTGSMAWEPDGSNCGSAGGFWNECADSRMSGLRAAVMSFYDTVEESTSDAAQVRYGVAPYASNVNVGAALMAENPSWMIQAHTYQSREGEPEFGDWEQSSISYIRDGEGSNYTYVRKVNNQTYHSNFDACVAHYRSLETDTNFVSSNESGWTQVSASSGNPRTVVYSGTATFEQYRGAGGTYYGGSGLCDINHNLYHYDAPTTITVTEEREMIFKWAYRPVEWQLAGLYDDNRINLPTGWEYANQEYVWNGCVEEADTVAASDFTTIPTGANDMDINLVPSNDQERWKPVLQGLVWHRRDSSGSRTLNELTGRDQSNVPGQPNVPCPAPTFRLTELDTSNATSGAGVMATRGDLQAYVDALRPNGSTYHDIGMLWGARFISPNGIFAADNSAAPNGDAIARHIIFMTDGELSPSIDIYNAYGVEWWDQRVSGDSSSATAFSHHQERLQAACRLARQENITVWVVAFGTSLTQNLIDCATPGRAFAAASSEELSDRFEEIAQRIAALRLTE